MELPKIIVDGDFWRIVGEKHISSPCSGEGGLKNIGRFNRKGQKTLYLAYDYLTASIEFQKDPYFKMQEYCFKFKVYSTNIVDLTDETVLKILNITKKELLANFIEIANPPNLVLTDKLIALGIDGVKYPSAVCEGINLALWRWDETVKPFYLDKEQFKPMTVLKPANER